MQYLPVEIDIVEPLPSVFVPLEYQGIGCSLRRNGVLCGFFLQRVDGGTTISPGEIGRWITDKTAKDLVWNKMREEYADVTPEPCKLSLSVAICTKDRTDTLARCIATLLPLQIPESGSPPLFEILVIDNAPSNQLTQEFAASFASIRYLVEPRAGLDFARNMAVREARGEFVAFLDDDVTVDGHWLRGLERAFRENPDAGAFTGPVLPYELLSEAQILFQERGGFHRGFRTVRYCRKSILSSNYPCASGMFGAGCNMAFRRSLLVEIGLFDEALDTGKPLPGGGDLDIFYRVVRRGAPLVYEAEFAVYHQHRLEYRQLRHQMWMWGLGLAAFAMKSYGADIPYRSKIRRMIFGYFAYLSRLTYLSARGRNPHVWSTKLALVELAGGLVGIAGEYGRSVNRTNRIRKNFA